MQRIDRINEEIRFQVSTILQRDLQDPRIGFTTITRVDTSPDLKRTSIYFTSMDAKRNAEETLKALKASRGLVRSLLAKRIRVKFVPEITFINDTSLIETNRIDEIIDILHKEKEHLDEPGESRKDYKK